MSDIINEQFLPEEMMIPGASLPPADIPIEAPIEAPNVVQEEEKIPDNDELATVIYDITRQFEKEDESAHTLNFNKALKSEYYWTNRQFLFKEATSVSGSYKWQLPESEDTEDLYFDNMYRPNGESIIAAMSVSLPQVNFFPDDADNSDDLTTAEAYKRIAELIQKHNKAHVLIVRALYILYNQSFVAFYNYNKKSAKYGTYKKQVNTTEPASYFASVCPNCGADVQDSGPPFQCNICGNIFDTPELEERTTFKQIVGYTDEPKTRECLHALGPTHVKIAPYAQTQEDSPYLIFDFERHPSKAKYEFNEYKDKLGKGSSTEDSERRDGRSKMYQGEYDHLDTWKLVWLRPEAFEELYTKNEIVYNYLVENYPDGLKATYVNKTLVELSNESIDDHWTVNISPLSTYINAESLGSSCLPIQDATNELMNLSMDTIKHGIPQTFADGTVLDLDKYRISEIQPGNIYGTKQVPAGRSLQEFILTTRTATLSQEVKEVRDALKQSGQFATGAFPSIYGGVVQGSRTASEYAQSRAQALQRLSVIWTTIKELWADTMAKACVSYARNLNYDEKDVRKNDNGYINVWIRQAELKGKIGKIEPEPDEQLPTSWMQLRDVMIRLMELNNPMINEVLSQPNNAVLVKNGLGMRDIQIPGYDDRIKQQAEIQDMLNGIPVMIDKLLDNHIIESEVCREFLISLPGRDLKNTNPPAYQSIYQHFVEHSQIAAANMMAQQQANQPEQKGNANERRSEQ